MKSLAQLSHLDKDTLDQLEAEVKSTYINACDRHTILSDYKLVISLFSDRSDKSDKSDKPDKPDKPDSALSQGRGEGVMDRQVMEQPKGAKAMSDRCCLELLPKDAIVAESDSGRVIRLIVNFVQ